MPQLAIREIMKYMTRYELLIWCENSPYDLFSSDMGEYTDEENPPREIAWKSTANTQGQSIRTPPACNSWGRFFVPTPDGPTLPRWAYPTQTGLPYPDGPTLELSSVTRIRVTDGPTLRR